MAKKIRKDAAGKRAFDAMIDEASAILDVDQRRKVMAQVEAYPQDEAVFIQPLWRAVASAARDTVMGYGNHPTQYRQWNEVWLNT